ncbi:NUDIX hydrolase [Paenibacillus sp. UNC451MF]|uniref:NUDIX hydrolase n=1 Tax=Paenibacillus sp. UNC451MF TaxID=1449063 RepID=UPI000491BF0C|nr:NUDIX hydrolase [Paenibacillus sp. UNC451MF]
MLKRVDVAIALIWDEAGQNVVMVKNKNGNGAYWSLPGGAVEPGETLEQAVLRETKEESGLEVKVKGLHSVREVFFTEAGHHALLFTFEAVIVGGELEVSDPDEEITEVKWMAVDNANELFANLPVKMVISRDYKIPVYSFHGNV